MIVTKIKFELAPIPNQTIPYFEIRGCIAEGALIYFHIKLLLLVKLHFLN